MVAETKKIMGDDGIQVAATCVRVPVLRCHGEAINVEFADEVTVEAARAALEAARRHDGTTPRAAIPMPGLLAGTNGVYVGRLRRDPTSSTVGVLERRGPDPQGRGAQRRADRAASAAERS